MNATSMGSPPPPLPSGRALMLSSLIPFLAVALAAAVTGMSVITTIAGVIGFLAPMIAAGTFIMSWAIRPDRSLLRAEFDLWRDKPKPTWLQHWYVPVIGAAAAGTGAELLRTGIAFVKTGAPLTLPIVAGAAGAGVLEGSLIALVFPLGAAFAWFILRPRWRRAA